MMDPDPFNLVTDIGDIPPLEDQEYVAGGMDGVEWMVGLSLVAFCLQGSVR